MTVPPTANPTIIRQHRRSMGRGVEARDDSLADVAGEVD